MSRIPLSHTGPMTPASMPPSDIYVQVDTTRFEEMFTALTPAKVALASKRAAARTRDWLLTNLRRELAQRAALPQKGLKGRFRRGGRADAKAYSNEGYAVLWIGLNPLEAQKAGTPRQTKTGVRVGRHFFSGAFIARIYSGQEKIWQRKGRERFPVVKMTIPINEELEEILPRYQAAAERMFTQRLEHEINYLLGLV